ncbi:Protein phosphatase PHLPP-like protein [Chionoecetes opilio]|uniref:Protein phosphatase PHLPP-like protein n=1 Tax=Chionoecetes opilio TaxID=41210 RepID=A0A8J4YAX7_CHIOP|nr:Protein phosphatase PHLPP-like protein [Chionoecetes opilio]
MRLNLSRNQLEAVPPWLVSSTEVSLVDVSHNQISSLPAFLTSGHLRRLHTLSAHHNCLTAFPVPQPDLIPYQTSYCTYTPHKITWGTNRSLHEDNGYSTPVNLNEEPKCCSLEVLYLHSNKIPALPSNLFSWLNRLRVLNVSKNQLSVLPGLGEGQGVQGTIYTHQDNIGGSKVTLSLQELYAAANRLRDLSPLQHCRSLRILHASYNRITSLPDQLVWSWELMEELVLSANQLTSVPAGVSRLSRLRVLKVHSNPLQSLPRLAHLSALKVVDASRCKLGHIELEEVVSPGLVALDISGNTSLSLDHHQFTKCKSRRPVSVVDVTSCSGRSLPLTKPPSISQYSQHKGDRHGGAREARTTSPTLPWSLGFAEAISRDSKLNVGQLRVPDVGGTGSVGVVAVADGGEEMGVVSNLLTALPSLLQEELTCSNSHTYVLKYALLTALRRLRGQGAMLPSAVCAAHLETSPNLPGQWPVLRLCCYGPVSAVVTTFQGQPIVLTTSALRTPLGTVPECGEGVRCSLSEPPTLPDPHTTELHLGPHHSAVAIASASLWEVIEPTEAADICSQVSEPGTAAKHLLDLAQAYGSRQAISVIVVQLKPPLGTLLNSSLGIHEDSAISNKLHKHSNEVSLNREYLDRGHHEVKDMTGTSRRVKFESFDPSQDAGNQCYTSNHRKDFRESFLCGGVSQFEKSCAEESHMVQNIGDLERSSPSGQSQSDNSEYWPDNDRETRTTFREFNNEKSKDIFEPSVNNLYSYSNRKTKDGKKLEVGSQIISYSSNKGKKAMTYYHYPRPEPGIVPSRGHLKQHLMIGSQTEPQTSVLAPPAGFGDPGSDSEGSDSGLSGVTEEQFRSWEYLLARNAKLLYMRELDTLEKSESSSIKPTSQLQI